MAFSDYLSKKYSSKKIDHIIFESQSASSLSIGSSDTFKGSRKFFLNPGSAIDSLYDRQGVVVPVETDYENAAKQLLKSYPDGSIYLVAGSRSISQDRVNTFRRYLEKYSPNKKIIPLVGLPTDQLLEKVSNLEPGSVIYYLLIFNDGNGVFSVPYDAAKQLCQHANVPVYSLWTSLLGSGIVGGYMLSGERVGEVVASITMDPDFATKIDSSSLSRQFHGFFYDWRQLDRWGIEEKDLPSGSTILFRDPSFYTTYYREIISGALLVIILLSVFWNCRFKREVKGRLEAAEQQKALLQQLEVKSEALVRSNSDLKQFAYIASHDLREPLRKISSFVELFEKKYKGDLDEKADQYIYYIVDASKRMQLLIDDLLRFSRVQRAELDLDQVAMDDLTNKIIQDLDVSLAESEASVEFGILPTITANPKLIRMVLQNLIANAVKFKGDNAPVIRVDTLEDKNVWHFVVKDNGIGIEQKFYEKIFNVFHRLHTREQYPGSGIGLSICRKVVERHNGKIWVESEVGKGSTFHFTIPKGLTASDLADSDNSEIL